MRKRFIDDVMVLGYTDDVAIIAHQDVIRTVNKSLWI